MLDIIVIVFSASDTNIAPHTSSHLEELLSHKISKHPWNKLYETLQVPRIACEHQIVDSYFSKLKRMYRAQWYGSSFRECLSVLDQQVYDNITLAFTILTNTKSREMYDRFGIVYGTTSSTIEIRNNYAENTTSNC
jgi:hypothetical protein